MYEVEIKILGIDRKKTEEDLISLGAVKVFDGDIHALYYDSADNAIQKVRGAFRLRKEGEKNVLTFKSYVEDGRAKVREEKEVFVSDLDAMKSILKSLGFTAWLEMKKHRTTYELDGLHFELDKYLDEYGYIPEFLEIEGKDIETVYRYAGLLWLGEKDCRPWDAVQVAEYYKEIRP